jgi:hypothetical protein
MVDRPVPAPGQTDELLPPVVSARPPAVTSGRPRSGAIVARILWLAAAAIGALVVSITARAEPNMPMQVDLALVELVAIVILFPTVGLLVALRRPESYAGWAMLVFGVAFGVVVREVLDLASRAIGLVGGHTPAAAATR